MTIIKRIYVGFLIAFILTSVLGGIAYFSIAAQVDVTHNIHEHIIPYGRDVRELKIEALMHRRYEKDFFLNIGNAKKQAGYVEKFKKSSEKLKSKIAHIKKLSNGMGALSAESIRQADECLAAYQGYETGFLSLAASMIGNADITPQQANKEMKPLKEKIYIFEKGVQKLNEISASYEMSVAESSFETGKRTELISLIMVAVTAICVLVLAVAIGRKIKMSLSSMIEDMHGSAGQVTSASQQVSSSSQSLAEGASEQAASIEETSSSLEEMSSMTKQNAGNARQADSLMKEANQVVVKANASMTELTQSMEEISKASEETSKIIKTIDEIAFQTNLLALNAAVEAARAGEAGAGFAVVADEVRNLAMRAADAAKSTADLIEGTVQKVQDGGNLVASTNEAFGEVASGASKVGELLGEIASASNEQASGIEQLNQAVVEMDKVVQQNAASAEETASASEEMSAQAEQMRSIMSQMATLVMGGRTGRKSQSPGVPSKPAAKILSKRPTPPTVTPQAPTPAMPAKQKTVTPEQLIPLDDDDFKDF